MSESTDRLELVLRRQAGLDRQMETLTASVQSLTRLFELQFRDVHLRLDNVDRRLDSVDRRLEGVERRLDGIERLVREYTAEQFSMANQILNAQQRADQAHMRLDETAI